DDQTQPAWARIERRRLSLVNRLPAQRYPFFKDVQPVVMRRPGQPRFCEPLRGRWNRLAIGNSVVQPPASRRAGVAMPGRRNDRVLAGRHVAYLRFGMIREK